MLVDDDLRLEAERLGAVTNYKQSIGSKIQVAPAQPADFRWLQGLAEQQYSYRLIADRGASLPSGGDYCLDFVEVEELAIAAVGERDFQWRWLGYESTSY